MCMSIYGIFSKNKKKKKIRRYAPYAFALLHTITLIIIILHKLLCGRQQLPFFCIFAIIPLHVERESYPECALKHHNQACIREMYQMDLQTIVMWCMVFAVNCKFDEQSINRSAFMHITLNSRSLAAKVDECTFQVKQFMPYMCGFEYCFCCFCYYCYYA